MIRVAAGQIERTGVDALLLPRRCDPRSRGAVACFAARRRFDAARSQRPGQCDRPRAVLRTGGVAGRSVCAVVGSGDNGGDALWAATLLRRRGASATAVLLDPERAHRKALAAFRKSAGRVVQSLPAATDLVIDGVVGISGSGPLRPAAAEVFAAVDEAGMPVVAVDIPSGVDVQTGAVNGPAVHAALTVTFGGLKPVHALGDCGRVELVDIGLDLSHPTS